MKRICALVIIGAVTALASISAAEPNATPEDCIRHLYRWYLTTVNANGDPLKQRAKMRQFATERLLKEIDKKLKSGDGVGSDYFVNAQDFDPLWAKNILISGVQTHGEKGNAHVLLKGSKEMQRKLIVHLLKEGGAWKVDRVWGGD